MKYYNEQREQEPGYGRIQGQLPHFSSSSRVQDGTANELYGPGRGGKTKKQQHFITITGMGVQILDERMKERE